MQEESFEDIDTDFNISNGKTDHIKVLFSIDWDYYFTIKGELPTRNEEINASKEHWGAEQKLKKGALEQAGWSDIKRLPKLKAIQLGAIFYRKDRNYDPDNITSAHKYILDALQEYDILENDGWKQVKSPFILGWKRDKHNPRTEIFLKEVDSE